MVAGALLTVLFFASTPKIVPEGRDSVSTTKSVQALPAAKKCFWRLLFENDRLVVLETTGAVSPSYTVSCVRLVYFHSCCTHIFLRIARAQWHSHIFMRVTYTHGSSVCKKVFARVSHLSISPSPFLMIHLSLLFPHGHFETIPDYDFTDDPVHTFLSYFPVLKAQDMRNSAPASRSLASWPSQMCKHRL